MKIEKIDRVGILVSDLDKAKHFFGDLFETEFASTGEIEQLDLKAVVDPSGIELVAPLTTGGFIAKTLQTRGPGLITISLKVANLDDAMKEIKSRGIGIIFHDENEKYKAVVLHPKDTLGVMIELVEYQAEHGIVRVMKAD